MVPSDSMAMGRIGRVVVATALWAFVWTLIGFSLAVVYWLLAVVSGDAELRQIPLAVYVWVYPGIGLRVGVILGLVYALVMVILKMRSGNTTSVLQDNGVRYATIASIGVGVLFAAGMIDGSIISGLSILATLVFVTGAGRIAARISTPWLFKGVGVGGS